MTEKRFIDDGFEAIEDQSFTDTLTKKTYYVEYFDEIVDMLNSLNEENEHLKHNNKMLSMKMSEVYTKYRLLKEFSEDTNPNDAVKRVLSELMQITKEYR